MIPQTVADDQFSAAVCIGRDGGFVVAWDSVLQDGSGHGVFARLYDAQGVPRGDEFQVNQSFQGDQLFPSVGVDAFGGIVIVWEGEEQGDAGRGIFARQFTDAGQPRGDEFPVHATQPYDQLMPSVATSSNGSFVVVWDSYGQDGDDRGILARTFAADGTPAGDEYVVNTFVEGRQFSPDVAADAAGNFVVTWTSEKQEGDDSDVMARRFAKSGQPVSDEFAVALESTGDQQYSRVSVNASGAFAVIWNRTSEDGHHVVARQFAADGTGSDGELQVSTMVSSTPLRPDISLGDLGSPTAVWHQLGADSNGTGVFARRYTALGQPRQAPLRVNTTEFGNQAFPVIATGPDQDFVVVWESAPQDGDGLTVVAQRYGVNRVPEVDLNGEAPGTGYQVDYDDTRLDQPLAAATASITDEDSTRLTSLTATLVNRLDGELEVVLVDVTGTSLTSTFQDGVLVVTAPTPQPIEDYEQVLRTLRYRNSSTEPTPDKRQVVVVAADQSDPSVAVNAYVSFNEPPIVDLSGGEAPGVDAQAVYTEREAPTVVVMPSAVVSDDHDHLMLLTFTLLNPLDGDAEALDVTLPTGDYTKDYSWESGRHVLTVTHLREEGASAIAASEILRSLTYTNRQFAPATTPREIEVVAGDGELSSDPARLTISVQLVPRQIRGFVYVDVNNNGVKDPLELGLPDVPVHLAGMAAQSVLTDDAGAYAFVNLPPAVYTITADQATAFVDGQETQGTPRLGAVGPDQFRDLDLVVNFTAVDYLFGERGLKAEYVSKVHFLASSDVASEYVRQLRAALGATWTEPHVLAWEGEGRGWSGVDESRMDVNGDGYITPRDALLVINRLNYGGSALGSHDVNNDQVVSPRDALLIINRMNRLAEGEGSASNAASSARAADEGLMAWLDDHYVGWRDTDDSDPFESASERWQRFVEWRLW